MANRLGDSRSKAYALAADVLVSFVFAPKPLHEFEILKRNAIRAASETGDAYIQSWTRWMIAFSETWRGRMNEARDTARELLEVGRLLNDPRSTGFGLNMLGGIALLSDTYNEAVEYSEQALSVAVAPWDRVAAAYIKGCALMLLRRAEEASKLMQDQRRRIAADGDFYNSGGSDLMLGLYEILRGNIAEGFPSNRRTDFAAR
jgi:hypothetical protein